ncbi:MAG TPA: transposase [Stellaceae bacterium]|nr:transposase [Stellaceae bacterium]
MGLVWLIGIVVLVAPALIAALRPFRRLIADRGYDSNLIRQLIADRGAEAVIPPSSARVRQIPYDAVAYRERNLVERLWYRLKDRRCIATRYDKLARNYLAGVFLAAILIYWIN